MKTFTSVAALLALLPAAMAALTINTPPAGSVVECQPILLSWTDGAPPYFLTIVPGGNPNAILESPASNTNAMQYTWNVDLPAGTAVSFGIKDSTGGTAYSDQVTIQANPSGSACISGSGSPTTGASTSTGSGSTASTTGGSMSSSRAGASGSASGSAPAASGTSTPSSAQKLTSLGAFSAVMGLVGAALF